MSPGATFERVYRALKEMILSGAFPPGAQLEPSALSESLVASITPVRDALHRLVGERLVHTPRNDGFRMPILTELALRDLFHWNGRLLLLALSAPELPQHIGQEPSSKDAPTTSDPAAAAARLFVEIARLSHSLEHMAAVAGLNDRLSAVRRKEEELFDDAAEELKGVEQALRDRDRVALRRLLAAYHRRRERSAPRLLELLQPQP